LGGDIVVTAALGVLVYALLGQIAELFYNCSFYIMDLVMLGYDCNMNFTEVEGPSGGNNVTITTKSCSYNPSHGMMTNFNFFDFSGSDALSTIEPVAQKLINLVWYVGWVILIVCAVTEIMHVINGKNSGSGAWLSATVRVIGSALLYYNWYAILSSVSTFINRIISGPMGEFAASLRANATPDAANIFGTGSGGISSLGDTSPGMFIFAVVLCFSLGMSVITASITYLERYFSAAIYMYVSPIAVALSANENTAGSFKDWLLGLIPQFAGLFVSVVLMLMGFSFVSAINSASVREVVYGVSLGIVFFGFSKNSEKFFNSMGIKTMQHGDAARSALAGAGAAMLAARAGFGLAKAAGNTRAARAVDAAVGNKFANTLGAAAQGNSPLSHAAKVAANAAGIKPQIDAKTGKPLLNANKQPMYMRENADGSPMFEKRAEVNKDYAAMVRNKDVQKEAQKAAAASSAAAVVGASAGAASGGASAGAVRGTAPGHTISPQDRRENAILNEAGSVGTAQAVMDAYNGGVSSGTIRESKRSAASAAHLEQALGEYGRRPASELSTAYANQTHIPDRISAALGSNGSITDLSAAPASVDRNRGGVLGTATVQYADGSQGTILTAATKTADGSFKSVDAGSYVYSGGNFYKAEANESLGGMVTLSQVDASSVPADMQINPTGSEPSSIYAGGSKTMNVVQAMNMSADNISSASAVVSSMPSQSVDLGGGPIELPTNVMARQQVIMNDMDDTAKSVFARDVVKTVDDLKTDGKIGSQAATEIINIVKNNSPEDVPQKMFDLVLDPGTSEIVREDANRVLSDVPLDPQYTNSVNDLMKRLTENEDDKA